LGFPVTAYIWTFPEKKAPAKSAVGQGNKKANQKKKPWKRHCALYGFFMKYI